MDILKIKPLLKPIKTEVIIPGSKSYTNRALIIATLAEGKSRLLNFSESDDSNILIEALTLLGVRIIRKKGVLEIFGNGGKFSKKNITINVNHAGTAMRFLTSLCALVPGTIILDGSDRMRERPIVDLVNALISLGVKIEYLEKTGYPPIKIYGGTINGKNVKIKGNISSQFITSLLLIAPILPDGLTIKILGKQISQSYIDMTIEAMKKFGVNVNNTNYQQYTVVKNQGYKNTDYPVEGDASGATYFWAIAAVTGSKIKVANINPLSLQGDVHFVDILEKMGCNIKKNHNKYWIEVSGPKQLKPVTINMSLMPDTAQILAVIAAFAKGKTRISGLSTLKVKETDRLCALQKELHKMNIDTEITSDTITVKGGEPTGALIETYNDHRMAMSFAVAGMKIPDMEIINPEVVKKSFPDFWYKFLNLSLKHQSIVLCGFRCTGKSTIGPVLAEKLGWKFVEMDNEIIKMSGKSIDELTCNGTDWQQFRQIECDLLKKLIKIKGVVISAGGGVGVNNVIKNNTQISFGRIEMDLFSHVPTTLVIVLTSSTHVIKKRIIHQEMQKTEIKRPIIDEQKAKKIAEILKKYKTDEKKQKLILVDAIAGDSLNVYRQRLPLYEFLSPYQINTGELNIHETIIRIITLL